MKHHIVDLFCGAGGVSTAILQAAKALQTPVKLTAVNHWPTAIDSHSLNHPSVHHICEPVESLWPVRAVPSRHLRLLTASCECTFHSNARGGGPCNEQSRSQPWQIIRWITDLTVGDIFMENVPEFVHWGPLKKLTKNGKRDWYPDPTRKGEYFNSFCQTLRQHGYNVEWRIVNTADYGDATVRRRFFLIARNHHRPITWPEPTHQDPKLPKVRGRKAWATARDHVIDWSLEGKSIFNRAKPLSPNTLKRIAAGLQEFGGAAAQPFLVMLRGTSKEHLAASGRSVDAPIPAVTTTGKHHYLAEPFLIPANYGERNGQRPRTHSLKKPLPTVVGSGTHAVIEPVAMVIGQQSCAKARPVSQPLPTVATAGAIALVQPKAFLLSKHSKDRPASIHRPLATNTTRDTHALVQPFITHSTHHGKRRPHSVKEPLPTVTGARRGEMNLIEPVIVQTDNTGGNGKCTSSIHAPIKTVVSKQSMGLVEPFVVKYYGTGKGCKHLRQPLDTVTTKDRFLLVQPKTGKVIAELDIRFRMLQPHELAAAHSFPKHYIFTGTKEDQTKQIGNSVPVQTARAHILSLLKH